MVRVRRAVRADLDALVRLEAAFPGDRVSRASFARFIDAPTADVWVAVVPVDGPVDGPVGGAPGDASGGGPSGASGGGAHDALSGGAADRVVGDAVVTYRRGFQSARLYTLVTDPERRGRGVASALLSEAERAAAQRGVVAMRLEVRVDNAGAIDFYLRRGYERVGRTHDYYQDHSDAWRMRKRLRGGAAHLLAVPYRPQSLDFTCGAAALMMALRSLGHPAPLGQEEELALWREATTVFMLAGHGGTSAHGLAVAALRRGFDAEVWVDREDTPFLDTVRSAKKKQVVEIAHRGFAAELARLGGRVRVGDFGVDEVIAQLRAGRVPLVLVSGSRLYAERVPHWVVATGWDDEHLYLHDPHLPEGADRADGVHLPLRRADFGSVARYGRARQRAVLVVGRISRRRGSAG